VGAHSRSKGRRAEQVVVCLARATGLDAERTWHTAQAPDAAARCCDVRVAGQPCQVKRSRDGYRALYDGLQDVAGLFVRADSREWLTVVRAADYLKLLRNSAQGSESSNDARGVRVDR
jgi:hypothetical protein